MPGDCKTILVVEDDPDIRAMLQLVLERAGYKATLVATGQAALHALEHGVYALLLTDLQLPDMSGADMLALARQRPCPPAILMSGQSWESLEQDGWSLPIAGFLAKPFAITTLNELLGHVLAAPLLAA
ncbi:MAG TPA: response regulator [Herpetosiphonaceae bacterium]|nr:response regulator [Herpetosiphonaceae bacterium]